MWAKSVVEVKQQSNEDIVATQLKGRLVEKRREGWRTIEGRKKKTR